MGSENTFCTLLHSNPFVYLTFWVFFYPHLNLWYHTLVIWKILVHQVQQHFQMLTHIYYTISKKSHLLIPLSISLEKSLTVRKFQAQKSAKYPALSNHNLLIILPSKNNVPWTMLSVHLATITMAFPQNNHRILVCNRHALCVFLIFSQTIKKMYSQGSGLIILMILTASSRTFISETEFFFFVFLSWECMEVRTTVATSMVWCHCLHCVEVPVVLPTIPFGTIRVNVNQWKWQITS